MTTKILKALGKIGLVGLATAALMVAYAPKANAVNNQDAASAWFDSTANSAYQNGSGSVGTIMNVTYTGSNAHAYMAITASSVTFWKDSGEATADSTIGGTSYGATGGTFDLTVSSVNTLGKLCDLINASNGGSPNYHCRLIGGLRSDTSVGGHFLPIVGAATDINTAGGYNIAIGSNTILSMGIIPSPGRRVILTQCAVNSQGTEYKIYGRPRKYSGGVDFFGGSVLDDNLVWDNAALSANTTATDPSTTPVTPWMEFAQDLGFSANNPPSGGAYDGKVVIRSDYYGSGHAAQTSSNFIKCLWSER